MSFKSDVNGNVQRGLTCLIQYKAALADWSRAVLLEARWLSKGGFVIEGEELGRKIFLNKYSRKGKN